MNILVKFFKKNKHLNVFWKEILLFLITQILGIVVAVKTSKILITLNVEIEQVSLSSFLIYFLIFTLAILALLKVSKKGGGIIFQIFFVLAIFSGLDILFSIFIGEPGAMILAFGLVILRFIRPTVLLHNLVVIGGLAGVGGMLGLTLIPRDAIILLVILAIYDVIAVYKTKHMVKMAETMIKKRAILGIIVPEKLSGFYGSMADVEKDKFQKKEKNTRPKTAKMGRFMVLGGGDLALPLLLISSVAVNNIWQSIIILFFSLLGLTAMHFIFIKLKSKPMPALPPLAVFSILGYFVSLLI